MQPRVLVCALQHDGALLLRRRRRVLVTAAAAAAGVRGGLSLQRDDLLRNHLAVRDEHGPRRGAGGHARQEVRLRQRNATQRNARRGG
jgi:hypothetical protein